MNFLKILLKFLLLNEFAVIWLIEGYGETEERKCKYLRINRLLKIRCHDMNLKEVPPYLKASVEILDLSFNRIKKLKRSSFQPYRNIKFLLLYENMIQSVEPETFLHLSSVQEIDLSNNALMTIPLEVFQLPSLRNLYVDSNDLINLERDLEGLETPIGAPLEYLNIADCGLQDLPDLGVLPKLWHINASMNPLMDLHVEYFASVCNLKSIDLTRTELTPCQCQQINHHLRAAGVKTKFVPICIENLENSKCPLPYNFTVNSSKYHNCKTTIHRSDTYHMWIIIISCIAGLLFLLSVIWCFVYKRRRRRRRQQQQHQHLRKSKHKSSDIQRNGLVISPRNSTNKRHSEHDLHFNHNDEILCCDI